MLLLTISAPLPHRLWSFHPLRTLGKGVIEPCRISGTFDSGERIVRYRHNATPLRDVPGLTSPTTYMVGFSLDSA